MESCYYSNAKLGIMDHVSEMRLPDCSKSAVNWKMTMTSEFAGYDVVVKYFWRCCSSLVKFKCHASIITGSGVKGLIYKGLGQKSRNLVDLCLTFVQYPGKLVIPNLMWIFLTSSYWILQRSKATTCAVSHFFGGWRNRALFVLEIITFFSRLFVVVGKQLDKKTKVNFKMHDVTD